MGKKCFLISAIGNEGSNVRKHADKVKKHLLEQVCSENDLTLGRVDELTTSTSITKDIFDYIEDADLAIVDITYLNPNVFFELGYRFALNKPFVIIKDRDADDTPYPFDIRDIRIFEYSLDIAEIEDSIKLLDKVLKSVDYSSERRKTLFRATSQDSGYQWVKNGDRMSLVFNPRKK